MEKEVNNITEKERSYFEEYFKEDLDAIEEELSKSKEYSDIIDEEIKKFKDVQSFTKGSERYLIEHITNAVQLQTQRQGLRKDRVAIKKLIMDYTNKALDKKEDKNSDGNLMDEIKRLLSIEQNKQSDEKNQTQSDQNLDDEIDKILEEDSD